MPRARKLTPLVLALTIAPALHSSAHADSPVIARGHGVQLTVGDVEAAIAQQSPSLRARYRDPAALKALVEDMVRQQLLANEAQKRGYDSDRAVVQNVKDGSAQALVQGEVDSKVTPESVPPADIEAYYNANAAEFARPAMRRAAIIVLDDAERANALLPEAKKADARAFGELARSNSREPKSKVQGGDIGYFTQKPTEGEQDIPASVREAAFALKDIGDTSAPVAYGAQLAIVRMSGERPERNVTLEIATPSIRTKLWRERRQQALDALVSQLRARDKPAIHSERIQAIEFDDMERRPSGFAPDPAPASGAKSAKAKP